MANEHKKGRQGFASMDPDKRRAIASMGGRSSHVKGFATMDPVRQREIARKGGLAAHRNRGAQRHGYEADEE